MESSGGSPAAVGAAQDAPVEFAADDVFHASGRLSPVFRALRYTGDEIQLGRVLAAVCQESAVARAFVESVLSAAVGGQRTARRGLSPVPADVTCIDERVLRTRVGRQAFRQRYKDAGRVDLD